MKVKELIQMLTDANVPELEVRDFDTGLDVAGALVSSEAGEVLLLGCCLYEKYSAGYTIKVPEGYVVERTESDWFPGHISLKVVPK